MKALKTLKTLFSNIGRKFKQMTCDHSNAVSLGNRNGIHFAFCKKCEKHLHYTRK